MNKEHPVISKRKERKKQKQEAIDQLNKFKIDKINLNRPVIFVAGWRDERCKAWIEDTRNNISIKTWFEHIAVDSDDASFINFEKETKDCASFLDFGEFLKNQIWSIMGKNSEFDIVGHSMGGLDIRAAMTQGEPLLGCHKCITVATPHQGDHFGGMNLFLMTGWRGKIFSKFRPMTPYHVVQGKNLDPDYPPIQTINTGKNRPGIFCDSDLSGMVRTLDSHLFGFFFIHRFYA